MKTVFLRIVCTQISYTTAQTSGFSKSASLPYPQVVLKENG